MLDRRLAAAACSLVLLTGACSSGGGDGDQVAAQDTAADEAPPTTLDELALIEANRCDAAVNHETYYEEADAYGVDTITGSFDTVASMGEIMEGRDAEAGDGHDHEHAEEMPADHGDMSAEDHADMQGDDTGHGGHAGPQPWEAMTDGDQCAQLEQELELAHEVAMRYPTIAAAKEAGFNMVTPYVPGMGSHLMNFEWVDTEFDIEEPEMLLFDGNVDSSQIVGLSYYVIKPGTVEPEVGFTGPNDRYHRHLGLCVKGGMVIGPESMTEEACESVGGSKSNGEGAWMQHTWVVPGCESPWGMYSGLNPVLDWEVVSETGKPGTEGCAASERDYDMTTPGGGAAPTNG